MQCACAIPSSVSCPALQYFSTLSHKLHHFQGKKIYWAQNVCFDFLCKFGLKHFFYSKKKWARYDKNFIFFSVQSALYASPILITPGFSDRFWKFLVFRLSPCSECSLCSFGNFPGVRSIKTDVSELNVRSIVLCDPDRPGRWNRYWVPKRRLLYFGRRRNSQKNTD